MLTSGQANCQQQLHTTLTETLNECAIIAASVVGDLNSSHARLFGGPAIEPYPSSAPTPAPAPTAASIARQLLTELRDIQAAVQAHHKLI